MQLAMIGLGRMGGNMVERLMRHGHELVVFDRSADVVAKYAQLGAKPAADLKKLVESLRAPRVIWIMVPAAIVVLEELPLNANGKVDRRALPEPLAGDARDFEPPRGDLEERIAKVWAEVLGVPRVSRQDNFFELGGHSLLATQIVARIRKAFQTDLPLRDLFDHSNIASLAAHMRIAQETQRGLQAPPLAPVEIQQDAVEPRVDAAAAFELCSLPGEDQERFLGQVVGIPGVARQHERRPMDPGKVLTRRFVEVDRLHDVLANPQVGRRARLVATSAILPKVPGLREKTCPWARTDGWPRWFAR